MIARSAAPPLVCHAALCGAALLLAACGKDTAAPSPAGGRDVNVATLGTVEVTAKLIELPPGAIVRRDLYNYATVLKYEVVQVHRGGCESKTIYVAHYNPWKPRPEAADAGVKGIGGNISAFSPGALHRMALAVPLDDHYIGGIINKYYPEPAGPIYFALWTNDAAP